MSEAVIINNIHKNYNLVQALHGINFNIKEGELFGLIGPDGAGKTSLMRILTTLILPDIGTASVYNFDIKKDYKKIRSIIGYMPQKFSLYQDLSVEENLQLFASIFETTIHENYYLVKDIYSHLEEFKTRRAGKLSGGMKQKLALSCALIHKPKILFLDEPTTGVDPVSRKEFWEMLNRLKLEGITIFVSTPYMDEASLCERVALIQHGSILDIDTPEKIILKFPQELFAITSNNKYELLKYLRINYPDADVYPNGEFVHFTSKNIMKEFQTEITMKLESLGYNQIRVFKQTPNIEDCFMLLMNKKKFNTHLMIGKSSDESEKIND